MEYISGPIKWFSSLFRRQGLFGKTVISCFTLVFLCCLCSLPSALFNPSRPSSRLVFTPRTVGITQTAATATLIPVVVSQTEIAPSTTPFSTNSPKPTASFLSISTSTKIPTGASCIPMNVPQTGEVIDVVDGDTIKVLLDQDGQIYTVRYIGMDTPEYTSQVEYFGKEASLRNDELVSGKNITLIKDVSETDRYGRLLRYVIVDNVFVNYELIAEGYANTASFPPDVACISTFQEAERKAASLRIGLWNVPPTLAVLPITGSTATSGVAPCNCSGPDLDCGDFSSHASAQACYNYCKSLGLGDIFKLDGNDNDSLACESLP